MVDVERVVHAARGMRRRHVERLEVVPIGLHFGPLGNLETEAHEHVFESFPGLGHQVSTATRGWLHEFGEIERLGRQLDVALSPSQHRTPLVER